MVKIRLTRVGRTHTATFRIVVADSRRARDGKFIEIIGRYQPVQKDNQVEVQEDRALYWLNNGAQPTETVRALLRGKGIMHKYQDGKDAAKKALKTAKA